jgi:HK97 family phage prohead protease
MTETKSLPVTFNAKSVRNDGSFEGYASTFGNIDNGYDVVMPGAFTKSLQDRPASRVKMLWQHDPSQPIGVWSTISEDSKGLFVKGRVLREVQKGAEAYALMKEGVIDSMSIGYRTLESDFTKEGIRQLKELGLMEVSLVTFPMNDQATVTTVKDFNPRDIEKALRDAGFAGREAVKAVAIFKERLRDAGVNVETGPRDEDAATKTAALAAALRKLETTLRA